MSDQEMERVARLLEEMRDQQRTQLERQGEALVLQKKQFELYAQQHERASRLQDRAEAMQERSAQIVGGARRLFPAVLIVIVALIAYVTWLLVRLRAL